MKSLLAFVAISATVCLAGCDVNPTDVTNVVESQGYKDVKVTGYQLVFSGCGKDDSFNSGFTATSADGKHQVSGVVCGGLFKGYTVRINSVT